VKQLLVDKSSGTFADQLTAFGLAVMVRDLLRRAYDDDGIDVSISDKGGHYQLALGRALDDDHLGRLRDPYMPAQVIVTPKNKASIPDGLPASTRLDYEEQRDRRAQFWALYNSLGTEERRAWRSGRAGEVTERLSSLKPHPHWDVFRAINPAALAGYNKLLLQWWQVQPALGAVTALIRDLYATTPNDIAAAEAAWKQLAKAHDWGISATTGLLQIYNPNQGKGQNSLKPDRLSMGNVKGFWLPELFKAVGYYGAALTKQPRGTKDRKTYVLAPLELELAAHDGVFKLFREAMEASEPPVRLDIMVSMRYLQVLLRYAASDAGEVTRRRLVAFSRPNRVINGFAGAYYKSLGNSQATMNVPFLGLPDWVQSASREQMEAMQAALQEHIDIVRQFDESHSDDLSLLLAYRDFCSGNSLEAFFEFAVGYSAYIIGRRERNQFVRQFTVENLRRLIMGTDPALQPILDTPGFRNIAYAIRQSTVVAQFRKKQGDRRYDVRYGLGQALARKAHYAADFVAELSGFLHQFNAENAQVMETRSGPYRRSVRAEDIDDIVRLIDTYGSRTVANLLVAYGYARTGAAAQAEGDQLPDDATAGADGTDDDDADGESQSDE